MKKVDFNKLQAGDLVEVPRTQFAPMRSGWNGWLFSEAVVIRKGVGRKSKKNVVVVEMRTPAGKNSYGTIEATFYAENVLILSVLYAGVITAQSIQLFFILAAYIYLAHCLYLLASKFSISEMQFDGISS